MKKENVTSFDVEKFTEHLQALFYRISDLILIHTGKIRKKSVQETTHLKRLLLWFGGVPTLSSNREFQTKKRSFPFQKKPENKMNKSKNNSKKNPPRNK